MSCLAEALNCGAYRNFAPAPACANRNSSAQNRYASCLRSGVHPSLAGKHLSRHCAALGFGPVPMRRAFSLITGLLLTVHAFAAGDWTLVKHDGRDYVTFDNLAEFYGLGGVQK